MYTTTAHSTTGSQCSWSSAAGVIVASMSGSSRDGSSSHDENGFSGIEPLYPLAASTAVLSHELLKAAIAGDADAVRDVLARGASPEACRPILLTPTDALSARGWGTTPLMYAAQGGSLSSVLALLEARASVNAANEDGWRPLHFAAFAGSFAVCGCLVQQDADPEAMDDARRTAMDLVPKPCIARTHDLIQWEAMLAAGMPSRLARMAREGVEGDPSSCASAEVCDRSQGAAGTDSAPPSTAPSTTLTPPSQMIYESM